jgi:hypothetical protein
VGGELRSLKETVEALKTIWREGVGNLLLLFLKPLLISYAALSPQSLGKGKVSPLQALKAHRVVRG